MTSANNSINTLNSDMTSAKSSINSLNTKMTSANNSINSLDTKMTSAQNSINALNINMANVSSRVSEVEKTILNLGNTSSNAPVNTMVSITYSELKALRDNSELVPGVFYRITDYQCTTSQDNTRAMDHKFDIIVQALSTNTLSENASADYHGSQQSSEENLGTPVLMESVLINKTIKSLVNAYYREHTDADELLEDYRPGTDIFVEWGYAENNDGETVPVMYKTDSKGVDPTSPGYNEEFADPDYDDVYYYVGTTEVDDVTYDRWRKIDGNYPWDSDSQIYVYTNVIVQDGVIELESKSLLVEVEDEEPRLDYTKVTMAYYEYVDFAGSGFNYEHRTDEDFKFAAFEYLPNNEGKIVPVLYDWYEDGIPKNDGYYYVGKVTIDGVVYDKWRKID